MEPIGLALTRMPSSCFFLIVAVLVFSVAWKAGKTDDDEASNK